MVTMAIELSTTSILIHRLQNNDISMSKPPIDDSGFGVFGFSIYFTSFRAGKVGGRNSSNSLSNLSSKLFNLGGKVGILIL